MFMVGLAGALALHLALQTPAAAPRPQVPTVADPARGLDLWRGALIGMTYSQVLQKFAAATPPIRPSILTGGEVDRLILPGIDLQGYPAVAHFFFKGNELVSVELIISALKSDAAATNIETARRISNGLTEQYRQPYNCGEKSFGDLDAFECKWLKPPLSIRLWYMDVAGQLPLFYVAFRQVSDPGYDL